jgi:hypothetical protein
MRYAHLADSPLRAAAGRIGELVGVHCAAPAPSLQSGPDLPISPPMRKTS